MDEYRLTARGAQGVTNLKATPKVGKTSSILLVNETSELMVISQWGKIIRIDTNTVRSAGRETQGVRLLNLEADDKVAAAVIIPPDEVERQGRRTGNFDPVIRPIQLAVRRGLDVDPQDGEISANLISREDLIRNKLASSREQDLLDVKVLRKA